MREYQIYIVNIYSVLYGYIVLSCWSAKQRANTYVGFVIYSSGNNHDGHSEDRIRRRQSEDTIQIYVNDDTRKKNATEWFRMIEFDIKFSFGTKR